MKLYVAGKWSDREKINEIIETFEARGHTITHNWTQFEGSTSRPEMKSQFAIMDINGVRDADAYIGIMNDPVYPYRGSMTEMGAALGLCKPVYVVAPADSNLEATCFFHHPLIHKFRTLDALMNYLN
jgi:nucleoside 2-deoxyribosyltransferase